MYITPAARWALTIQGGAYQKTIITVKHQIDVKRVLKEE